MNIFIDGKQVVKIGDFGLATSIKDFQLNENQIASNDPGSESSEDSDSESSEDSDSDSLESTTHHDAGTEFYMSPQQV